MGIFTSSKPRAEQSAQARLAQAQANANRLRIFLATIATGLDSEGYHYAQRAIGLLVAIAGWPSLVTFIYQLGSIECDVVQMTSEDEGRIMDRTMAKVATNVLLKAYAEPLTLDDVKVMQTVACILMVWWGFSDIAEPKHPIVRLLQHFGGHPFNAVSVEAIQGRMNQIRSRITPGARLAWNDAEQKLSTYGNGLLSI